MLSHEESRILAFLRKYRTITVDPTRMGWNERVISELEWLGYITLYPGQTGRARVFQITERGLSRVGKTHVLARSLSH